MSALIVVNFKTYASAQGDAAVSLAKAMAEVDATTDATMVAVVSAFDLSAVKGSRAFSRSLDPTSGSNRLGF